MKDVNEYVLAINLVTGTEASNNTDLAGLPIALHCLRVGSTLLNKTDSYKLATVGVLHDIIEDRVMTKEELIELGFSEFVVNGAVALDKTQYDSYETYIESIAKTEYAIVKKFDILDNLNITRLNKITEGARKRINKYLKSLEILNDHNH